MTSWRRVVEPFRNNKQRHGSANLHMWLRALHSSLPRPCVHYEMTRDGVNWVATFGLPVDSVAFVNSGCVIFVVAITGVSAALTGDSGDVATFERCGLRSRRFRGSRAHCLAQMQIGPCRFGLGVICPTIQLHFLVMLYVREGTTANAAAWKGKAIKVVLSKTLVSFSIWTSVSVVFSMRGV